MSIKENKTRILRQIEEVWNNGNSEAIADFWDEKLPEEIRQSHTMLLNAFPDLRITAEEMIAENDKVVARLRFCGTHLGTFMGTAKDSNSSPVSTSHIFTKQSSPAVASLSPSGLKARFSIPF